MVAPFSKRVVCVLVAVAGLLSGHALHADDAGVSGRRARRALSIGDRSVTVGEIEDAVAMIPLYQRSQFGGSAEQIVRAYIDQVLARDLLLVAGSEQRGLHREMPVRQRIERALSTATLRHVRGAYTTAASIPREDVQRYFDEHRAQFETPERIRVWRILCSTREQALSVLAAAQKDLSTATFTELARERSVDKATNFRGGNLGFLDAEGVSNEAGLRVDARIVTEARTVKDGALVARPVPEGDGFAVVWRRATVPAKASSADVAADEIRAILFRQSVEAAEKKTIEQLRATVRPEVHESQLAVVELRPFDAGVSLGRSTPKVAPSVPLNRP